MTLGYIFRGRGGGGTFCFKVAFKCERLNKNQTTEIKKKNQTNEQKLLGAQPQVFCFFVESVASGFPVRCDLISSISCNDLISGNALFYV